MSSVESFDSKFDLEDFLNTEVRTALNLDSDTVKDVLDSFRRIKHQFILEGEETDWLACALYVSCRKCLTQTNKGQGKIEGNMVSLTAILRTCNISLVKFFQIIKKWINMANMPIDMNNKIDQIEKNFNVTSVIFKKFKPIFEDIFQCPIPPCRFNVKTRKIRRYAPLNSLDVFTFCWTLFVFIKSRYSKIGDDLVNSYHMLLVCIDYCFTSVLMFENCREIINNNFYDHLSKTYGCDLRTYSIDNRLSIIDTLCNKWKGVSTEIKMIRKHWFKTQLKNLIEESKLRKKTNGIIDTEAIDYNFKYIKSEYEKFVLTIGDFDECIFLNETASRELGTSELQPEIIDNEIQQRNNSNNNNQGNTLVPATPLSSKQYLAARTTPVNIAMTPISSALNSVGRLHSILMNRKDEPSEDLERLFRLCDDDPKTKIKDIIEKMGNVFVEACSNQNQNQSVIRSTQEYKCVLTYGREFAEKRRDLAKAFFYYILEKIVKAEINNKRIPETQFRQAFSKLFSPSNMLIPSLFACSLEIILFSYNLCNQVFPWILEIYNNDHELKIPEFFFYKVIEPIIREEPDLSRDIVKHLGSIEEKILDSLVWKRESPIWTILVKSPPPSYSEVLLNMSSNDKRGNSLSIRMSPLVKPEINNSIIAYANLPKRQLFPDKSLDLNGQTDVSVIRNTKNVNPITVVKEETVDENSIPKKEDSPSTPVQKISQISLFFRKVYTLASTRLEDLLKHLKIQSDDIKRRIWTCLEHTLQSHIYLMCDHHLDQMIMCSVYAVLKIYYNMGETTETLFANIIESYRFQPQSCSQVYRNVLMTARKDILNGENENSTTTADKNGEDIIEFYNKIFLPHLTLQYIGQFQPVEKNKNVELSPMPTKRISSPCTTPVRCMPNSLVYLSPLHLSKYESPRKPISNIKFQNNFNTSKELENLNNLIKSSPTNMNNISRGNFEKASIATSMTIGTNARKRILQDDNDGDHSPRKASCINRKVREIYSDRQNISGSSSNNASASVSDDSNDSLQFNSNLSGLNVLKRGFRNNLTANNGNGSLGNNVTVLTSNATPLVTPVVSVVQTAISKEPTPMVR